MEEVGCRGAPPLRARGQSARRQAEAAAPGLLEAQAFPLHRGKRAHFVTAKQLKLEKEDHARE